MFSCYYHPAQQLSVDEMIIGTRCRVSFLQYLPKKPTKFGIKVFVNAEAKMVMCELFKFILERANHKKQDLNFHKVIERLRNWWSLTLEKTTGFLQKIFTLALIFTKTFYRTKLMQMGPLGPIAPMS